MLKPTSWITALALIAIPNNTFAQPGMDQEEEIEMATCNKKFQFQTRLRMACIKKAARTLPTTNAGKSTEVERSKSGQKQTLKRPDSRRRTVSPAQPSANRRDTNNNNTNRRTGSSAGRRSSGPERRYNSNLSSSSRVKLDLCVDAVLAGTERVEVKINGHEFKCEPPSGNGNLATDRRIGGHLVHKRRARFDEAFFFRFAITDDGHINEVQYSADNLKFANPSHINSKFNIIIPKSRINRTLWYADLTTPHGDLFFGTGWRGIAKLIAATTAVRLSQSTKYGKLSRGQNSPILWNIDRVGGDYKTVFLYGSNRTPRSCKNQCRIDGTCKAWAYRPAKNIYKIISTGLGQSRQVLDEEKSKARCYLKDSISQGRLSNFVVSGINQ